VCTNGRGIEDHENQHQQHGPKDEGLLWSRSCTNLRMISMYMWCVLWWPELLRFRWPNLVSDALILWLHFCMFYCESYAFSSEGSLFSYKVKTEWKHEREREKSNQLLREKHINGTRTLYAYVKKITAASIAHALSDGATCKLWCQRVAFPKVVMCLYLSI
jgi:hypothetical protein